MAKGGAYIEELREVLEYVIRNIWRMLILTEL